ncbi:M56 family metallopeptidase [Marinoscillum sp.]|uniref:M56 family metallopeptidase n=1 Tax=Marinoscillum sp. TaxID=2024838 RepID=UPI003BA8504D
MSFLTYLLEAACCQFLFWIVYRLFLHLLSSFHWNRLYLLASVLLAFLLPALEIPVYSTAGALDVQEWSWSSSVPVHTVESETAVTSISWSIVFNNTLLGIYLVGFSYFIGRLSLSIRRVFILVRRNQSERLSKLTLIHLNEGTRFFTFWKWVFVSGLQSLDDESKQLILAHEKAHVDQRHTLDLVLLELATIVCWFNPCIYKIKSDLRLIHEFQADEATMAHQVDISQYSHLMLSLAGGSNKGITHSFSKQNLKKRIMMINSPKSDPMSLFRYALILPIILITGGIFSCTQETDSVSVEIANSGPMIKSINWEGNTEYTDKQLTSALGIQEGERYSKSTLDNIESLLFEKSGVTSLYMDNGYLFFRVEPTIVNRGESVELEFDVYEGPTVVVNSICVLGNLKDYDANHILSFLDVKTGPFNRSDLISSQQKLSDAGITAIPYPEPYQEGHEWFVKIEWHVE